MRLCDLEFAMREHMHIALNGAGTSIHINEQNTINIAIIQDNLRGLDVLPAAYGYLFQSQVQHTMYLSTHKKKMWLVLVLIRRDIVTGVMLVARDSAATLFMNKWKRARERK